MNTGSITEIYDRRKENIFVINDVSLIIPPTNISIQKEDLVYQWRTLRSKSTTKIPSGHGNIAIQITVPFTGSMMLDLHRLIVEFRHSPFCYVENRFLRESIVPDWPIEQNMAFTMTGLHVTPMKGSSDTWVMQLDLVWFNYAPFTHNFLYREDWVSEWIERDPGRGEPGKVRTTIGWSLNKETHERTFKPVIIAEDSNELDVLEAGDIGTHKSWSATTQEYLSKAVRTIEDMEALHQGEVFDLLPIPDRMAPSAFRGRPIDSRIYVRYINLLQRDALLRNFDIDAEADLERVGIERFFFAAARDSNGKLRTLPLHRAASFEPVAKQHRHLISQWLDQLDIHQGGVRFTFAQYKDIRLSQDLREHVQQVHARDREQARAKLPQSVSGSDSNYIVFTDESTGVEPVTHEIRGAPANSYNLVFGRARKRSGWTHPVGKHSPVGRADGQPKNFSELLSGYTSVLGYRSAAKLSRIYGTTYKTGRPHWGTDFNGSVGDPVFAVAPGKIWQIRDGGNAGTRWFYMDTNVGKRKRLSSKEDLRNWEIAIRKTRFPTLSKDTPVRRMPVGTVVYDPNIPNRVYWNEFGASGQYIVMEHDDGHSIYMHLHTISEEARWAKTAGITITQQDIEAGFVLGTLGSTSYFTEDWVKSQVGTVRKPKALPWDSLDAATEEKTTNMWALGPHLHFEYWEKKNLPGANDPAYNFTDGAPLYSRQPGILKYHNYVPVDPIPSLKLASGADHILSAQPRAMVPTKKSVKRRVGGLKDLDQESKNDLIKILEELYSDNWWYYDRDSQLRNVWWKVLNLDIQRSNPEILAPEELQFLNDSVVLTSVAGGLRHVVANIPVLGHEFPTQQHLGSIEPYYSMEFCATDDSYGELDGLPEKAQAFEGMRSTLHQNSRRFRPITDSWCVLGDSFITRLLGTYQVLDYRTASVAGGGHGDSVTDEEVVSDVVLKRRLIITRASSDTWPGQPGLSCHSFEMSETNPYEDQVLETAAPDLQDVDAVRAQILQAVATLNLVERYKPLAVTLLIAQLAGAKFTTPGSDDFGQFGLRVFNDGPNSIPGGEIDTFFQQFAAQGAIDDMFLWREGEGENSLLIRDPSGSMSRFLGAMGVSHNADRFSDSSFFDDYIVIEPGQLSSLLSPYERVDQQGFSGVDNVAGSYLGGTLATTTSVILSGNLNPFSNREFNMAGYLTEDQDRMLLAEIPFDQIAHYWDFVNSVKRSAELLLSEELTLLRKGYVSGNPLSRSHIDEQLYGIGVEPSMWRAWQRFLLQVARDTIPTKSYPNHNTARGRALKQLKGNPNWLAWNSSLKYDLRKIVDASAEKSFFDSSLKDLVSGAMSGLFWTTANSANVLMEIQDEALGTLWDNKTFLVKAVTGQGFLEGAVNGLLKGQPIEGVLAFLGTGSADRNLIDDSLISMSKQANRYIANSYISLLPLTTLSTQDRIKSFAQNEIIVPFVGDIVGADQQPVFANTTSNLTKSVLTSGCWHGNDSFRGLGYPSFIIASESNNANDLSGDTAAWANFLSGVSHANTGLNARSSDARDDLIKLDANENLAIEYGSDVGPGIEGRLMNWKGLYPAGSPFVWPVNEVLEAEKLEYFRRLLAQIADDIRTKPDVLRAFGLEHLHIVDQRGKLSGSPAYPDLDLPPHPYYGNTKDVSPDFYMWNMYQDGGAFSEEVRTQIEESLNDVVTQCYESMQRMQAGQLHDNASQSVYQEASIDGRVQIPSQFTAEGTDGEFPSSTRTAMASPFYMDFADEENADTFFNEAEEARKQALAAAKALVVQQVDNNSALPGQEGAAATLGAIRAASPNAKAWTSLLGTAAYNAIDSDTQGRLAGVQAIAIALGFTLDDLKRLNPEALRLSLFEGPFGEGGGVHVPLRTTPERYTFLRDYLAKLNEVVHRGEDGKPRSMFGSRSGYLNQTEVPEDLEERNQHTKLYRMKDPAHRFDPASLSMLAKQSSNDIVSQKMMMRRAYPTFKLYFVEEDEFETRLLNFDDFYSYNGVTGFTVVQSNKSPADHAVITIQNVAGTLDGTKRDSVVDLDYFSKNINERVDAPASAEGNNPVTADTAQDQPFGALVLRPGLNIQLRAGFANNPDDLHVLINGRVTDIQWNKQADTAEIMVQSFGVELIQAIKGTNLAGTPASYYTTHQLLGALMLEPEVVHFGRWEFNQMFMAGEGQDARLDFRDYSREGYLGSMQWSTSITKFMLDWPVMTGILAIAGLGVLGRIPGAGKALSYLRKAPGLTKSAGLIDDFAARYAVAPALDRGVFRKALARAAASNGGRALTRNQIKRVVNSVVGSLGPRGQTKNSSAFYRAAITAAQRGDPAAARQFAKLSRRRLMKSLDEVDLTSDLDVLSDVLLGKYADARTSIMNAQWFADPLQKGNPFTNIGFRPLSMSFWNFITNQPKIILGGATAGLGLDLTSNALGLPALYDATAGRVNRYFQTAKVSMMLSPQDDNLFPPHPKDYMRFNTGGFFSDIASWTIRTGLVTLSFDQGTADAAGRWFGGQNVFDKRVDPSATQYFVIGSTIWDIFHEMSLRHPGWVYGTRPYGNKFRYTMFFGVPSQRYWSKPADNEFIKRSNDLHRMLAGDGDITIEEYRRLYGEDAEQGVTLTELVDTTRQEAAYSTQTQTKLRRALRQGRGRGSRRVDAEAPAAIGGAGRGSGRDAAAEEKLYQNTLHLQLSSRALKEYLRSIQIRFVPFRRYHMVTSDRDIVWNGLLNSENAVYNAVDVTYFNEGAGADPTIGPVGSALFKAHTFIPDHKLRIMPLPPYRNCRGYEMATRYGMGQLVHNMKSMYRGEIIVLGNPRIRPWDVCIMVDTYNDMVGPFEVEQVVHTFTHETGFITELKPAAIVFANEISSWPILEAMKTASMAVKTIEESFVGLREEDLGSVTNIIDWVGSFQDPEFSTHASQRAKEIFGDVFSPTETLFGGDVPPALDESSANAVGGDIGENALRAAKVAAAATALGAGIAVGVAGARALKAVPVSAITTTAQGNIAKLLASPYLSSPSRRTAFAVGGATVLGVAQSATVGAGLYTAAVAKDSFDMPSVAWLLGGPLLLLNCLKNDSVIVVPLMKNGHPIVSGLSLHDPSSIWNSFKGDLGRYADDIMDGSRDLIDLWRIYGAHAWRRLPPVNALMPFGPTLTDSEDQGIADLTNDPAMESF